MELLFGRCADEGVGKIRWEDHEIIRGLDCGLAMLAKSTRRGSRRGLVGLLMMIGVHVASRRGLLTRFRAACSSD